MIFSERRWKVSKRGDFPIFGVLFFTEPKKREKHGYTVLLKKIYRRREKGGAKKNISAKNADNI